MKKPFALLSALLLSACVASPSTDPQTKQVAVEALGLGQAAAPSVAGAWWKQFADPQVERLAAQLLAGNPTLQAALARIRAADAGLAAEQTSVFPQVSFDGEEQRQGFSKNYIIPPPYGGTTQWVGQIHAGLNWNIDFWGKQAALIEQARSLSAAATLDAEGARLALSGALAQTYIHLWLAYQSGDIARQAAVEREKILELTQGRFNSGLEDASALEQAKAQLSLARIDVMRFDAQRDMLVHAIAALTGQGAAGYASIVRPAPRLDAALVLPAELPADLLGRRVDILAARGRVEAAMRGREAAYAEFYPNINLTAFVGFSALGLSNLFTGNALDYGAGPAIHLPIFDAGKIRAEYAGATADLDVAVADYNKAVLNAVRQTADALTQVKSLDGQRAEQQAALDSASRAFEVAQSRYTSGLSGQIVLLNAESLLLTARQQMAALAAETAIQRVTLLLSAGGTFNPEAGIERVRLDAGR
jgi:NodT family efflux transporter outer membrane factor (OMF) lipoprotein